MILLVFTSQSEGQKKMTRSLFEFHSGEWINLHHFVYYQALLRNEKSNQGLQLADSADLNILLNKEKQNWQTAIKYYTTHFTNRDLLMDSGMEKIKNLLEDREGDRLLNHSGLSVEFENILNTISPGYLSLFWEKQNNDNQRWIRQQQSLLPENGDMIAAELSGLYLSQWPKLPVRVDVTNYANWSGAYTTLYPTRITISSTGPPNQNLAGLEIIFHEASHMLVDSIRIRISEICQQDNKMLPRRDLWHAVLFYTTGEVIRKHYKEYVPYAYQNGLWEKAWPMYLPYLEKDWLPYIKGETTFENALKKLVRDVEINK